MIFLILQKGGRREVGNGMDQPLMIFLILQTGGRREGRRGEPGC
jgi:hypothetical protein